MSTNSADRNAAVASEVGDGRPPHVPDDVAIGVPADSMPLTVEAKLLSDTGTEIREEGVVDRSSATSVGKTVLVPDGATSDTAELAGDDPGPLVPDGSTSGGSKSPFFSTSGSDSTVVEVEGVPHPSCEGQINNLVDMAQIRDPRDTVVGISEAEREELEEDDRKKLVASEALREWKESQSGLQGKVERRTKQADKLLNEIYQLVGLYSVFVGVVFTAAVQSQTLRCRHVWSPLVLCAFAWLTIILVTKKQLKDYAKLLGTIKSEERSRAAIYDQISKLKVFGYKDFDFTVHVNENRHEPSLTKDSKSRAIQIVLTALTLILAGSFVHILCF